ncbi:Com family DNA-binding transcriptional regulator [Desulfovibrio sp. X2]|uniref:Com family DNA-binding transcriptional regulator n=1 Tax=Desulfovibrio sp. X2 TaxID=941449 RepID=UPI00041EF093|nr:Com family DNA-binding transcriptional regulator [Desulfovibrio sp. X2]
MTDEREIRCGHCGKLLARGEVITLHIRCPRCRADNHVRAMSPRQEGREPLAGGSHAHSRH